MANPNSLHSINLFQNLKVRSYNSIMLPMLVIIDLPFCTYSKDIYNWLFSNDIYLVFIPKIDICAFYNKCV